MGSVHCRIFAAVGVALALWVPTPAPADEGGANALFVEAVQAWQEAESLIGTDTATYAHRVKLLETVRDNLDDIIDRHPDSGLAVRLVIGEEIGPLSLATAEEALREARAMAERKDEACFADPSRGCLADVLLSDEERNQDGILALILMQEGRTDEALALLDDDAEVTSFLIAAPPELLSIELLAGLAQRVRDSDSNFRAGEAMSLLARAAAEIDPSAELAAELIEHARPRVLAAGTVAEQAAGHVNLSAAYRALGDTAGAQEHLQEAALNLSALGDWNRWNVIRMIARERIRAGEINTAVDLLRDNVEVNNRINVLYGLMPDLLEAEALKEALQVASEIGQDRGGAAVENAVFDHLGEAGRLDEAEELLDTLPTDQQRIRARLALAMARANAGDTAGAAVILETLSVEALAGPEMAPPVSATLASLAMAQWAEGELLAARKTMERAESLLDGLLAPKERFFVLRNLAHAEAVGGNLNQAHRHAAAAVEVGRATEFAARLDGHLWSYLAQAVVEAGRGAEAVSFARLIEDEWWRRMALLNVARILPSRPR